MMKHEFEIIAGYEVTDNDYYNIIEPMYMAVDLDKYDFVKLLDKKRFALPQKKDHLIEVRKIAKEIKELYKETETERRNTDLFIKEMKLNYKVRIFLKKYYGCDDNAPYSFIEWVDDGRGNIIPYKMLVKYGKFGDILKKTINL